MANPTHKPTGYQKPDSNRFIWRVVVGTVVLSLAIFAILPFTQVLTAGLQRSDITQINTVNIPPPEPPPPEPPPPPEEEEQEEQPELEDQPPPMSLDALESALNPGIGDALTQAFSIGGFGLTPDTVAEIQIFDVTELDRRPTTADQLQINWPPELEARGIAGIVRAVAIIDEQGRVSIERIQEATHPGAVQPIRQALVRLRFTAPTKDGEPVRARYIIPVRYDLSQ